MATAIRQKRSIDPALLSVFPMLDDLQAGSLRHIFNRASQLPDDWSGMMGRTTLQEDFSGLRFQLAYMSYALGLAHVHRLPAAPGLFREPFDALIQKILSPDVWLYWHYVSTGNGPLNAALGELPAKWNPVETDNIMYSAYVQSMALMYHYLFRDPKYAEADALTFAIEPLFWGAGGKRFAYDERSLNDHLYWNMVERGYLGIACEPNCVFQICNQPPILGFRFHDLVHGGDTASEVTSGYLKAWADFGMVDERGHFTMMVQEHERVAITPPNAPWVDFWLGALMHAWNPDFVREHYPRHLSRWSAEGPEGTLWIKPSLPVNPAQPIYPTARDHGWAAVCASEVGDRTTLDRLLAFADRNMRPRWTDGGYHYPRHDEWFDADGHLAAMDPHTSNALLPYARLNIPGGLEKLYAGPLDDAHFASPAITGISDDADLRRAVFDRERDILVTTLVAETPRRIDLVISNITDRGPATVMMNDGPCNVSFDDATGELRVSIVVEGQTDLVMAWS